MECDNVLTKPARFAAPLAFAWLCSVALFAQAPQLKQYVYADDGFVIASPVEPVLENSTQDTNLGRVAMHGFVIDLDGDSGVSIYAADFKRSTGVSLTGARDGFLGNLKARLLSERPITLAGTSGIEFEWQSEDFHGRAQTFFVGGVLYQVLGIAPLNRPLPPVVDNIFRPFRLLQKAA